jgi:hypothetical protein
MINLVRHSSAGKDKNHNMLYCLGIFVPDSVGVVPGALPVSDEDGGVFQDNWLLR